MFKKILLALVLVGVLVGGAGVAWFKFMRPVDPFAAAKVAMEKGDLRTAMIELRNTVRQDPTNAEAHFRLGAIQLRMGDAVAAERGLRQARDNGFDPRPIAPLMAQAYMAQGRFRDLLRDFPVDGVPQEQLGSILVMRGLSHLQLGELDPAFAAFVEAEKAAPTALEPLLAAARVQIARRDFAGAEARVDRALTMNAKSADGLVLKAQLLNLKGDRRNALSALDGAVQNAPGMIAARLERANLLVALGDDAKAKEDVTAVLRMQPRSAGAIYLEAVIAARAREFAAADEGLTKIATLLPRFPRGYYFLAVVKFHLGQAEQAADAALKFVSRNPADLDGLKLMARINMVGQRADEAISVLTKAVNAGVQPDAETLDLLGRAYAQNGQQQLALATYERAVAMAPDNADIRTRLASIRLGLGDAGGAAKDLEQSLDLEPKRTDAGEALIVAALANGEVDRAAAALERVKASGLRTENIGVLEGMVRAGELNFEAAREAFTAVLRDFPGSVRARINLARVAMLEGKSPEAERYLAEVLRQEPAHDQALTSLVNLLLADGRVGPAIAVAEAAHAAAPANNALTASLAGLYLRNNEARKALEMVEAAQKEQPPSPPLIAARARAQVALGMLREAQEGFREVLAQDPTDAGARRALVEVMLRDNSAEAARALLRDGLAATPGHPALVQTLIAIDLKEATPEKALETLAELQRDPKNMAASRGLRGDIYMTANRYNEAAVAYVDDLRTASSTELVVRAAGALNAAGRTPEANKLLREWLARKPDDRAVMMMLISNELKARNFAEAEELLQKLLEQQPNNVIALNNLAWVYHQKNDPRARSIAQKAYLLAPSAQVSDTFGWILTTEGEAVRALPLLRQASRDLPNEPTVQYHFAVALAEAGQPDEAVSVLRPLVADGKKFDEKAEAAALLERLNRR